YFYHQYNIGVLGFQVKMSVWETLLLDYRASEPGVYHPAFSIVWEGLHENNHNGAPEGSKNSIQ
ncbi:MAG: hypothetical protein ACI4SD_08060, partial [Suilimivivens sp.]